MRVPYLPSRPNASLPQSQLLYHRTVESKNLMIMRFALLCVRFHSPISQTQDTFLHSLLLTIIYFFYFSQ